MTLIEWTHRPGSKGESWNPIRARNKSSGLTRGPGIGHFCVHVSEGCRYCYAERFQPRFGNPIRYAEQDRAKVEVFLDEAVLLAPLRWRKPRTVFVCSMTDLFGEFVDKDWLDRIFAVMALTPKHTYQVLTKRASRMYEYLLDRRNELLHGDTRREVQAVKTLGFSQYAAGQAAIDIQSRRTRYDQSLVNVWLGVSAEDQSKADERIPLLLKTPAALHFLSAEPLLEAIDLRRPMIMGLYKPLDWIIAGGESGPKARPCNPAWVRALRRQCAAAGVPFFFKQWGNWQGAPVSASRRDYDDVPAHRKVLWSSGDTSIRMSKKAAGRALDGRTYTQFPG